MSDITIMKALRLFTASRSSTHPTLPALNSRVEVCPPSLRHAPTGTWQRLKFWLLAPAPHEAAPPLTRLPAVREDFLVAIADVCAQDRQSLERDIHGTRSLRELWHLRAAVYRVVAVAHSQSEAERRVALLNQHFPTRAPRSGLAALQP